MKEEEIVKDFEIRSERIDQIPVIYGFLERMHVVEIINNVLPKPHGNWKGLSYGELAAGFILYILTQGDHRISYVEDWAASYIETLRHYFPGATAKDFTDDRLESLLEILGNAEWRYWEEIEKRLGEHLISAYRLPTEVGRIDTTTGSVYHTNDQDGGRRYTLFHYGYNKDHRPDLMQFLEALGTIDPLGMPIVSETLPGNTSDSTVYLAIWRRMVEAIGHTDFITVGDCKLTSLENQARIDREGGFYLGPLSWASVSRDEFLRLVRENEHKSCRLSTQKEGEEPIQYFETLKEQRWEDPETGEVHTFETRYLVVRSPGLADKDQMSFKASLMKTEKKLAKLQSQLGKRDLKDREGIMRRLEEILSGSEDLFNAAVAESIEEEVRCEGRGRPGPNRKTRKIEKKVFHLSWEHNEEAIAAEQELAGYRVYVTNAPQEKLPIPDAMEIYRDEWTMENNFKRLKGKLLSMIPLYLRNETCVSGLLVLLVICLQVLTLIEFVVRRNLDGDVLEGLYTSNPRKKTDRPTAERILGLFKEITLYYILIGEQRLCLLSPLTPLQKRVLTLLELPLTVYEGFKSRH